MKIALAGPPQSGKTENANAIAAVGWQFINLNETGDALRRFDGPLRHVFEELAPGKPILDKAGKRQAAYYEAVKGDPSVLERFTTLELPHIIQAAKAGVSTEGNAVLSWEQWELIADIIHIDRFLFLDSRPEVWIERLRQRAYKRGYSGPPLPDNVLVGLMATSGFSLSRMLAVLTEKVGRDRITVVDTSPDDWGAENIQQALTALAR